MVTKRNIRWIPLLMIISQLMLTGFVAYWLASQYRDEKQTMHADLVRLYDQSYNQVIDSLLLQRVVVPALRDSISITMLTTDTPDSLVRTTGPVMHTRGIFKAERLGDQAMIAVGPPDSMHGTTAVVDHQLKFTRKPSNDMLIRSVKLFISHTGDSTVQVSSGMGFPPGMPDTALFRKVYSEKIENEHLGVSLSWIADTTLTFDEAMHLEKSGTGAIFVTAGMPAGLPGVKILNGFPYLIGRITPQILFALILLLLTGSAFFFTNRSLKRQLILNGLRNDFVSNITHELKTPVSTVKVALEALKTFDKVNNPEKTRDYLEMAGLEMNRLDRLINSVLDQSLIGEQGQIIQPQLTDLEELIRTTIGHLEPRIQARNATVQLKTSGDQEPIMCDPLHLQGVISNLIDNSLKYGNEAPSINISIRSDQNHLMVELSDDGPGIPEAYLGRVFDKFFRVPTGNRHNIKGYGLGLSYASQVMKQHQGSIRVRNLLKGGCSFTLTLPKILK